VTTVQGRNSPRIRNRCRVGWGHPARRALTLASLLLAAPSGAADLPPNFAALFGATTVAFRPAGGSWDGAQHDLALTAGIGRYVSKTLALEVDLGPTWVRREYASFSVVPGVVWAFSPHAYLAARFPITVDPDSALYAAPGFGLSHTFATRLTPTLEANVVARVGHGRTDLAVTVTLGLLYSF
jgi:hypothetical protein